MKEVLVSIIVPVFRGEQYYTRLYNMAFQNFINLSQTYESGIELIWVNDCPDVPVKFQAPLQDDRFTFLILETDINRGIHGARVRGLEAATGKYIFFLDQDDEIKADCLLKQVQVCEANHGDVIVANGMRSYFKKIYTTAEQHEKVSDLNNYVALCFNPIVSPGQTLIKKTAIPEEWIQNIQTCNGADDFLLWIMMLKKERKFVINANVLYYHNPDRTQSSVQWEEMRKSENECIELLYSLQMLNNKEYETMRQIVQNRILSGDKTDKSGNQKFREMFFCAYQWLKKEIDGRPLYQLLEQLGYKKIAIYGIGYLGECLYKELRGKSIEVVCVIDQKEDTIWEEGRITILKPEDELPEIDAMIVTSIYYFDEIRNNYAGRINAPIISLMDLVGYSTH